MKKTIIIAVLAGLIGVAALAFVSRNQLVETATDQRNNKSIEASSQKPDMSQPAAYVDYVASETAPSDRPYRVLFFKADWCYTCTGLHKDIEANNSQIPADVQIIRVDYDKETQLKQKYDVRQQHTLVQIDQNGNIVKKWVLSPMLKDVIAQVERS